MPGVVSPFNAVPNGIAYPATAPNPLQALLALRGAPMIGGGMPMGSAGPMAGPMAGGQAGPQVLAPPPMDLTPPSGPISGPNAPGDPAAILQQQQQQEELDLFQRVVQMLIDPQTKQLNPELVLIFAGMGLGDALEKTGKYKSNPHRSNVELAAQGYDVGNYGQTGLPSPAQMQQQVQAPQPPKMPGF